MKGARITRSESGQATLEYALLIVIVVGAFALFSRGLRGLKIMDKVMIPLNGDFAHAYQYGHPKALGLDDGGPRKHPHAFDSGSDNGRIFYVQGG